MNPSDLLASWADTPTRTSIEGFVAAVTDPAHPRFAPPDERIAVFDNDGTLWCEKPMPVELAFILARFDEQARADPALRERQPWKAAVEHDYAWLGNAITAHYQGDDTDVHTLMAGILHAFDGVSVEDYAAAAWAFLDSAGHPSLGRRMRDCAYQPMVELLGYLEANEFTTYIASGGDRDFMRPITSEVYGIPPERVIGSSVGLQYVDDENGGTVTYQARMDVFDDGPAKPVRIWSRVGRRPLIAAGNSNGDVPMLRYADSPERPGLQLLVLHDDADREFAYTAGSESALEHARERDWAMVSVKNDWTTVFADL
jgi:phosphoserine phosphatase